MQFHEKRFPARLSKGAVGGPERRTEIITVKSGYEERNTSWKHSRRRFDAGVGLRSLDDLHTVISFFEICKGQLCAFRWKDWSDYKSCPPNQLCSSIDQDIAVGDGITSVFQLEKIYRSGESTYRRKITKPVSKSIKVALSGDELEEGAHFEIDETTGLLTFYEAPLEGSRISVGFEYDIPVRFDTDRLDINVSALSIGEIPNVPVVEVMI